MAVTIDEGSISLKVVFRPLIIPMSARGGVLKFACTQIRAEGRVKLNGKAGDKASDWELGFLQVQWIETFRLSYRGLKEADGSIFIERGRPPARPSQGCRDTVNRPASEIWYFLPDNDSPDDGDPFPASLIATFSDRPGAFCDLIERNTATNQDNYLTEAQAEYHFCTVLALRGPDGEFRQLRYFYWNVHWQATVYLPKKGDLTITAWPVVPVASGTSATVGHIIRGEVTHFHFKNLLTGPATQTCNQIAKAAEEAVKSPCSAGRFERRDWKPVRDR